MKKSTKLLSVILAIVMIFTSMSVLASATKIEYKTQEALGKNGLNAYSPYGAVTRLTPEERLSILLDYVDLILGNAGIKTTVDATVTTLTFDFSSINGALETIDMISGLEGLIGFAGIGLDFGILEQLELSKWQTDMSRDGSDGAIVNNLLANLLQPNKAVITDIIRSGTINLGIISVPALNAINAYLVDIPGLIKGLITPLLERKDDTQAWADELVAASSMDSILTKFVQNLFTKPQSTTTVKADAEGNLTSNHELPATEGTRYYYVKGVSKDGTPQYTAYVYNTDTKQWAAEEPFVLKQEVEGSDTYVFAKANGETLKYYEPGSYWLPSLVESGSAADIMNISTQTGVQMLYNMIPYVFGEMAPVVLNGSVKKLVAEWFGAQFNYVGEVDSDEVKALGSDPIFTDEQGEYLWEWSDYAVIDGEHYYRFEDSIYKADLSNCNAYMDIVDWNYEIPANLLNKYIPQNGDKSQAGYNTILKGLNNFFGEVVGMVLAQDVVTEIGWKTGSNENLLENVKKTARVLVTEAPEAIFGEHWEDDAYYNLMVDPNTDNQTILCCIAAKLLEFLMPQLILPDASSLEGQSLGAMLAMVIRELATQLIPTYNYDDLIFTDYNTKTLRVKDNSYWLDVCLTMGVDIGMAYLRNLADLGDDVEGDGYAKRFTTTSYTYASFDQTGWEDKVDWVIDWALSNEFEWTWGMGNLVYCGTDADGNPTNVDAEGNSLIDLDVAQDPWVKLGNILKNLLPIDQILNVNTEDSHWLETALRTNFVEALLNLDLPAIVGSSNEDNGVLMIPTGSVLRSQALLPMVINVVRDLLNDLLGKVANNTELLPDTFNSIDSILSTDGLITLIGALLDALPTAYTNGLLDVALPFVNFFLGYTTNAPQYSTPQVSLDTVATADGNNTLSTTITVTNTAAGMPQLHRNAEDVQDADYILVIDGVSGEGYSTDESFPISVQPLANGSVTLTQTYTEDKVVDLEVTYHFELGGQMLGEPETTSVYQLLTNKTSDISTFSVIKTAESTPIAGKADVVNAQITGSTGLYVASPNAVKSAVNSNAVTARNIVAELNEYNGTIYEAYYTPGDTTYLVSTGAAEALRESSFPRGAMVSFVPVNWYDAVDPNSLVSGTVIDLGQVGMKFYGQYNYTEGLWGIGNGIKGNDPDNEDPTMLDLGNLYYANTQELSDLVTAARESGRVDDDYTPDSWAAYETALKNAIVLVDSPVQTATFSTTYSEENIQAHLTALQDAIEGLEGREPVPADITELQAALDGCEANGEINYQDYELFEYWDYEEQRTATRNILAAYERPVAPDKYIEGSDLSEEEINAIVAAEGNSLIATAITNTMQEPTQEELDAYEAADAAYTTPGYTQTDIDIQEYNLTYYHQFLAPNAVTTEKQFLAKELAYAAAQNYVETAWSTDSWGAYEAALEAANQVNTDPNALQSEVFDAKYNLMLAQNNLVPAEDSAKDNDVYDDLIELIATADSIFADTEGAWTVKDDVEPADAYKQLVEALGYEYEDADNYTQNLYWDSAKAFVATDRIKGDSTTAATNAMTDKLQAAIDNFEATATEPNTLKIKDTAPFAPVIDLTNKGEGYTGSIYGIDTLGWNDTFTPDGMLSDFLTTELGDEYLRITTPESSYETTGTVIEVLDADGSTVLETYVFVYFGDIDEDGFITGADGSIAKYYEVFYEGIDTLEQMMAADVDGDAFPTGSDGSLLEYFEVFYTGLPSQADAAAMASTNIYELI